MGAVTGRADPNLNRRKAVWYCSPVTCKRARSSRHFVPCPECCGYRALGKA